MFFKANTGSCDGYCWRFGLDADVRRLDVVHTKDLVHYRLPPDSRFQVVTPDHSLCFHKRTDYIIDSFLSQSTSPCFLCVITHTAARVLPSGIVDEPSHGARSGHP